MEGLRPWLSMLPKPSTLFEGTDGHERSKRSRCVHGAWSFDQRLHLGAEAEVWRGNGLESQPSVSNDGHGRGATQTSITGWVFKG